ncbi:MAG: DNA repair protein RecO [Sandaracinaceae bacterium]|nr:DNA repair protein RecO [Sandaracinaceae bacterium]
MARTETTAAVLLASVDYGEADRIVTLLTEAHGKVALMARGARKSRRRFAGALEPYALLEAELALGRGEVGRLAQARVVRAFPRVLASLDRIAAAAAGLELVRETASAHEAPDARLLPTVARFFERVEDAAPEALDRVHVAFALRLLALTGHAPNLERCGSCGRPAPAGKAALFAPRAGAIVCRACGGGPHVLAGPLRMAMLRAGTRAWDEDDPDLGLAGLAPLRAFLEWHLGKPLAAGAMRDQVRGSNGRTHP